MILQLRGEVHCKGLNSELKKPIASHVLRFHLFAGDSRVFVLIFTAHAHRNPEGWMTRKRRTPGRAKESVFCCVKVVTMT
jgi:hypothetical protein